MQSNTPEIPTSVSENPFALVEQAATQYKQKNFETALDLLVRAEILARKTKRPEALVVIFSMAGNVFTGMEEFEKALRYFEKSLEIINMFETVEEKEAEKEAEAGKEAGKEREAEKEREENKEEKNEETGAGFDCEKEAEESEPESIFIEWSASNEGKIGNLLFQMGQFTEAEIRLRRALKLYEKLLEAEPEAAQLLSTSAKIKDILRRVLSKTG